MSGHLLGRAALSCLVLVGTASVRAEVVHIRIDGLAYVPSEATVRVGDTVEWTNDDFVDHTATSRGGDWDVAVPAGTSARIVVAHPGIVQYYCRYHPNMSGELRISGK